MTRWRIPLNDNRTREVDMSRMRAMAVSQADAKLTPEERNLPEPGRHEVRIRVHACGVCHSDSITVEGLVPGIAVVAARINAAASSRGAKRQPVAPP
jgi:hypothetical protein